MKTLQPCPGCGSERVKLNKKRDKFRYECDGDCWTTTNKWYMTREEAADAWNSLVNEREKKGTNFISNGEKIRQMSDEELVSILRCPGNIDVEFGLDECAFSTCGECKLKWLKEKNKHGSD